MHIPDGVLPAGVCIAGYAGTAAVNWLCLGRIHRASDPVEGIPRASVMAAAFFVASWIHIPVPPTSVHLVLTGLMGVILGWYAFPAILMGLFFQAVLFGHGGLTTLGVNALTIGLPSLIAFAIFRLRRRFGKGRFPTMILGFLAGGLSVAAAAVLTFLVLIKTIPTYLNVQAEHSAITALTIAYMPIALLEGIFTALVAVFLLKVKPEMLEEQ